MKVRYTIQDPCHEDWNQMTPNEQGRFCDVCTKTVFDLRGKSQPEIASIFQEHQGNLCGRMTLDQVNHKPAPQAHPVRREPAAFTPFWNQISRVQKFALALLVALGLFSFEPAKGQLMGKIAAPETIEGQVVSSGNTALVRVLVLDEFGNPSAGRTVALRTDNIIRYELFTDDNGVAEFPKVSYGNYHVLARGEFGKRVGEAMLEVDHKQEEIVIYSRVMHEKMGDVGVVEDHVSEINYEITPLSTAQLPAHLQGEDTIEVDIHLTNGIACDREIAEQEVFALGGAVVEVDFIPEEPPIDEPPVIADVEEPRVIDGIVSVVFLDEDEIARELKRTERKNKRLNKRIEIKELDEEDDGLSIRGGVGPVGYYIDGKLTEVPPADKLVEEEGADGSFRMRAWPNPTTGPFSISLKGLEKSLTVVRIVDGGGVVIHQQSFTPESGEMTLSLDVGDAASGVYHVQVLQNGSSRSKRIVRL